MKSLPEDRPEILGLQLLEAVERPERAALLLDRGVGVLLGEMGERDFSGLTKDERVLDDVFELADIALEFVRHQPFENRGRDPLYRLAVPPVEAPAT